MFVLCINQHLLVRVWVNSVGKILSAIFAVNSLLVELDYWADECIHPDITLEVSRLFVTSLQLKRVLHQRKDLIKSVARSHQLETPYDSGLPCSFVSASAHRENPALLRTQEPHLEFFSWIIWRFKYLLLSLQLKLNRIKTDLCTSHQAQMLLCCPFDFLILYSYFLYVRVSHNQILKQICFAALFKCSNFLFQNLALAHLHNSTLWMSGRNPVHSFEVGTGLREPSVTLFMALNPQSIVSSIEFHKWDFHALSRIHLWKKVREALRSYNMTFLPEVTVPLPQLRLWLLDRLFFGVVLEESDHEV